MPRLDVATSAGGAPAMAPTSGISVVRGLELGGEGRRSATLGVSPDDRVGLGVEPVPSGSPRTDPVQEVAPFRLAHEVR